MPKPRYESHKTSQNSTKNKFSQQKIAKPPKKIQTFTNFNHIKLIYIHGYHSLMQDHQSYQNHKVN